MAYINRLGGNAVGAVVFDLKAANNIRRGSHEIGVKLSYKDSQRNTLEDVQNIYLNVGGKSGTSSNIQIDNLDYPTTGIRPGNDFLLGFDLVNNGKLEASNIIVKVESGDPAVVPKTASIKKINLLEAGKSEHLTFIFTPTKDAETRNYPINISIEYEDELNQGTENKYLLTQYVAYTLATQGGGRGRPMGKPKLIIDKYNFEPSIVKAGDNLTMNLSFFNTNKEKAVKYKDILNC